MAEKTEALNVRLPAELHEQLRLFKFATNTSINSTIVDAVTAYMADDGPGHAILVDALNARTSRNYGEALAKLT